MSDKQEEYVRGLVFKAQGSFLSNGYRYTMGSTICRIVEEWCEREGLVITGKKGDKSDEEGVKTIVGEEEMGIVEAGEIIRDLDPAYDFNGKPKAEIIEYAERLRG